MKHIAHNEGYRYMPLDETRTKLTDFDLAVTLICMGCILETIDEESKGKLTFVFKDDEDIRDAIEQYWSNKLLVSPLEFSNARKNLKSRMYGIKSNY